MGEFLNKFSEFFKRRENIKVFLIILVLGLVSFQLRAQPADMGFTNDVQLKNMFADENGRMYLIALDPYWYLRLTENYHDHGHLGETLKEVDGKLVPYDTIQYAPPGHPAPDKVPILSLVTLGIYSIWHSFDSTVTLMNAAFWVPALMGMLLGIPIFFMIRRSTSSNVGGVVGALIIASSPALLYKTSAGFADTPIFEVLPILFIAWFIMEAIHYQNNLKKSIIFTALATLLIALYPRMWAGWWYAYNIVTGFLIIYLAYLCVVKKSHESDNFKNLLSITGLFVLGGGLLVSVFYGINSFINGVLSPVGFTTIKVVSHATGWPNVYTTVSELSATSFNSIVNNSVGSIWLFIVGILGVISSFISLRHGKKEFDVKYGLLLILWLAATGYAATKGVRFIGLMTPPLAIGIGILAGQLENIVKISKSNLIKYSLYPVVGIVSLLSIATNAGKIPEIILPSTYVPIAAYGLISLVVVLLLYKIADIISSDRENKFKKLFSVLLGIALVLPSLASAVPLYTAPTFNDGWKESLDWIKTETPNNSVITCWWDNGHIYTWATRKMVTFDGGSQNSPRAYWVGKAYSTSNENLSVGILRMLATSGDKAFEKDGILMNKTNNSVGETVKILNEILPVSKSKAYNILVNKYNLTEKEALEVLNATHPENPNPDYLITYNRMTDIAPVWSMFGNWDFSMPPNTPNEERESGYYTKLRGEGVLNNGTLFIRVPIQKTQNYAVMNVILIQNSSIASYDLTYNTNTGTVMSEKTTGFHKVIVKNGNNVYEKEFNKNGTISEIVRLVPVGNNQYYAYVWIASRNLEDSIYTRLHFLDGYGLKHIKLVKESQDPTNYGIQPGFKVYEVDYGIDYLN